MYCANCGQQTTIAFRCQGCHHFSITFWLSLFTVVAWLAIVAMNYAFMQLISLLALICAGVGVDLPQIMLWKFSWAHILATFGLPICVVLLILVPRLVRSFGRFSRLGRATTVFSSLALVFMAAIGAADGHYLVSFGSRIEELMQQIDVEHENLRAQYSIRSVIIAEYRYREMHPKVGFTCDLASLEPLGGPANGSNPYTPAKANKPNTLGIGIFTLSLRACQGTPVTKYEVSAVMDPSYGTMYEKAAAFCSDGSGALYSAADGKSETCLNARTPVH